MHISKLHFRQLPGVRFTAALGLLSAAGAAPAAETVGNALPYEGWLQTLQQSLTSLIRRPQQRYLRCSTPLLRLGRKSSMRFCAWMTA